MNAFPNNRALLRAINHSNMESGDVIVRLNGETIHAKLTNISMNMRDSHYTTLEITGIVTD